jgi:hypothetical protein
MLLTRRYCGISRKVSGNLRPALSLEGLQACGTGL